MRPSPALTPATALQEVDAVAGEAVSAWLTGLDYDWGELTRHARRRHLARDEALFHEGERAATVYAVEDGRVRLSSFSLDGHERHLMILGPTGLVGDCGLLAHDAYVVSAFGAADTTVCAIPTEDLLAALERQPALLRQHMQLSAHRMRVMLQHLALQGPQSGPRRVCHHLLGLLRSYGVRHPEGIAISITFTQQEMGCICGLSRVSVAQIFAQLERDGIVGRIGRQVLVRDVRQLAARARG